MQAETKERFKLLEEFYKINNRFPLKSEKYRNNSIGSWLFYQRDRYLEGKYDAEIINELFKFPNFENFCKNKTSRNNFIENFELFKKYFFTNFDIPKIGEKFEGINLQNWYSNQRNLASQGKLESDSIKKFNEIGIDLLNTHEFLWIKEYIALFLIQFSDIVNIKENQYTEKDLVITFKNSKKSLVLFFNKEFKLNNEFNTVFINYTNKQPVLSYDRIINCIFPFNFDKFNLLCHQLSNAIYEFYDAKDEINFEYIENNIVREKKENSVITWFKNYNALSNFVKTHKRIPVSGESGDCAFVNLGSWLHHELRYVKFAKAFPYTQKRLEDIGVDFSNRKNSFLENKQEFLNFVTSNKRLPGKDDRINDWFQNQIGMYRNNKMDDNTIVFFKKIDNELNLGIFDIFKFNPKEEQKRIWLYKYSLLEEYIQKTGINRPIYNLVYKNENIGSWCIKQRNDYRDHKLEEWQFNLLQKLDFDFSIYEILSYDWDKMYEKLSNFIKANHRFPKKQDDVRLYKWYTNQRYEFKDGKLSEHQINELEKIYFPFDLWLKNYYEFKFKIENKEMSIEDFLKTPWYKKEISNKELTKEQQNKINILIEGEKMQIDIPTNNEFNINDFIKENLSNNYHEINKTIDMLLALTAKVKSDIDSKITFFASEQKYDDAKKYLEMSEEIAKFNDKIKELF